MRILIKENDMANGKPTTREMIARIDERTENMVKGFDRHLDNHKWLWVLLIAIPASLYAVSLLIGLVK